MASTQAQLDELMIDIQIQDIAEAISLLRLSTDAASRAQIDAFDVTRRLLSQERVLLLETVAQQPHPPDTQPEAQPSCQAVDQQQSQHLDSVTASEEGQVHDTTADPAPVEASVQLERCTTCLDQINIDDLFKGKCRHHFCIECMQNLIRVTLTDPSVYPPRCCNQSFDLPSIYAILSPALAQQYREKLPELEDRTPRYCHSCSAHIPSQYRHTEGKEEWGDCIDCGEWTCLLCNKAVHGGRCKPDEQEQMLEGLAGQEGWQRCPACKHMVELSIGCNHITCRCTAEFCYICTKTWKTCRCPQWDEHRLLARAAQQLNREQPGRPVNAAQIRARAAEVEVNHDCRHMGYHARIEGGHACEECGSHMPDFILECPDCRLRRCLFCKLHRTRPRR